MEGEINNFITLWFTTFTSLIYLYTINKTITNSHSIRVLTILPIIYLLLTLSLNLHSITISGFTIFFIVFLTNLKLISFAFHKGPLSPPLKLSHFIATACFPIKIIQNYKYPNKSYLFYNYIHNHTSQILLLIPSLPIFVIYKEHLHNNVISCLYCVFVYIVLDMYLDMVRHLVQHLLGVQIEKQFDKPHLATSLQDFWGRRWNIMVSNTLKYIIYNPIRSIVRYSFGDRWAKYPAILVTFLVSGFMHELLLYCYGRKKPTWNVTYFFLLHGLCVDFEVALKSNFNATWRLRRWVVSTVVVAFAVATAAWLFVPEMLRSEIDVKIRNELIGFKGFVEGYCKSLYVCF